MNVKPVPSVAGVHLSIVAPCGTYMQASRARGWAAVWRSGVCAGTIDSRSGRARIVPDALQERAPRHVLLGDEHHCGSVRADLVRIWNWGAATTPWTSAEKR